VTIRGFEKPPLISMTMEGFERPLLVAMIIRGFERPHLIPSAPYCRDNEGV